MKIVARPVCGAISLLLSAFASFPLSAATYPNGTSRYASPPLAVLPSAPAAGIYTPATKDSPGIQAAINAAANAGGGTVQLASGNYTLNSTIVPKSNVYISGAGQGVTFLNRGSGFVYPTGSTSPTWTGLVYSNNPSGGVHDIKISALTVNGALSYDQRAAQWPGFYGIAFESDATTANHNLRLQLSSVEIKNCGQGFHCKGSTEITLSGGWYWNNGGGNLFFHNIYFRRAGNITIDGVTSTYSGAHGIKVAGGTSNYPNESMNVTVKNSTVNNNDYTGCYITGVANLRLEHNTWNYAADLRDSTVVNGAGILLDMENGIKCQTVDIVNNVVQNSYAYGVRIYSSDAVNVQGNRCNANATNYEVHATNLTCDYNTL
jgi:polygalacturonase